MQPLIGPAAHHPRRDGDAFQLGSLARPEIVEPRMLRGFAFQILDLAAARPPPFPDVRPEGRLWDAAVASNLPVRVAPSFPRVDGGQVRGIQFRDPPLRDREVGDAGESDLAVAPRPGARPLDQFVEILGLFGGHVRCRPDGIPGSGNVGDEDRVPVRNPILRVGCFEGGQFTDVLRSHPAARVDHPDGRRVVLAVRRPGDDHGRRGGAGGAVDVGENGVTGCRTYFDVALDQHSIAALRARVDRGRTAGLRRAARRAKTVLEGCGHLCLILTKSCDTGTRSAP